MKPVVRLLDNFNRPDAPTLGAGWLDIGWTGRMYRYEIVGNTVRPRYVGSGGDVTAVRWQQRLQQPYEIRARLYAGGSPTAPVASSVLGDIHYLGYSYATAFGMGLVYGPPAWQLQMCYITWSNNGAYYSDSVLHSGVTGWIDVALQMTSFNEARGAYLLPGETAWRSLVPHSYGTPSIEGYVGLCAWPNYHVPDSVGFDDFRAGMPDGPSIVALGTTAPTIGFRRTVSPNPVDVALGTALPGVRYRHPRLWNLRPRSFVWRCHDVEHP